MTGPQFPTQHDDPLGEARQQLLQTLAVAATVGEAGARWVAVGLQQKANNAERAARTATDTADRLTARSQPVDDTAIRIEQAFSQYLDQADLPETARIWRAATVAAAAGNPRGAEAMARAEDRLRRMHPGLMDAYDQHRAAGRSPADAMRAAAHEVWEAEARAYPPRPGRPHAGPTRDELGPGANGRAIGPAGTAINDLDAAIRSEVAHLAEHVSPEALDRLQREWRAAGRVPAADAAGLLLQYADQARADATLPAVVADQLAATARAGRDPVTEAVADNLNGHAAAERGQSELANGTPDLRATPVNEHATGLVTANVDEAAADHDTAGAAQRRRMAQTFPPLTHVGAVNPIVADKQAAHVVPTRQIGRTR
jgi:hypothetical protein